MLPEQASVCKETVGVVSLPREITAEDYWTQGYAGRIHLHVPRPEMNADDTIVPLRRPSVLYLHNGDFVCGPTNDADAPTRHLVATLLVVVVMVGYSLTPVVPFPTVLGDVYAAPCYVADHASAWSIDHHRIAVAGHDTGGNLLAALPMIARDRGSPHLCAQVLIMPMFDPTMARVCPDHLVSTDNSIEVHADCHRQYLPRPTERIHPYAAPVESCRLQSLSPALLLIAPQDLLRTEVEHYIARLIEAGVIT